MTPNLLSHTLQNINPIHAYWSKKSYMYVNFPQQAWRQYIEKVKKKKKYSTIPEKNAYYRDCNNYIRGSASPPNVFVLTWPFNPRIVGPLHLLRQPFQILIQRGGGVIGGVRSGHPLVYRVRGSQIISLLVIMPPRIEFFEIQGWHLWPQEADSKYHCRVNFNSGNKCTKIRYYWWKKNLAVFAASDANMQNLQLKLNACFV